jgi:hypothetical protein
LEDLEGIHFDEEEENAEERTTPRRSPRKGGMSRSSSRARLIRLPSSKRFLRTASAYRLRNRVMESTKEESEEIPKPARKRISGIVLDSTLDKFKALNIQF